MTAPKQMFGLGLLVLVGIVLVFLGATIDWQSTDVEALAEIISIGIIGIMGMLFYTIPKDFKEKE